MAEEGTNTGSDNKPAYASTIDMIMGWLGSGAKLFVDVRSAIRNDTPYIGYPAVVSPSSAGVGSLLGSAAASLPVGKYLLYIFLGIGGIVLVSKLTGRR
jgi:hypothetical protein